MCNILNIEPLFNAEFTFMLNIEPIFFNIEPTMLHKHDIILITLLMCHIHLASSKEYANWGHLI